MRGAVVDDQEHALRTRVGRNAHELLDERVERRDAVLGGAAVEDLRPPCVPGGEIAQCALAFVLVLDPLARVARGGQRWRLAPPGLDRGFLVGADDEVARLEQLPLPATLVEVEDRAGLGGEVGVAREDPRAIAPRPDRVLAQPAPDRRARDLCDDPALDRLARDLSARPARERDAVLAGQLARQRLDLGDLRRGKKTSGARAAAAPPGRPPLPRRTACATPRPIGGRRQAAPRSRRWTVPPPPSGSPWRARHHATAPSRPPPADAARAPARRPTRSGTGSTLPPAPSFDVAALGSCRDIRRILPARRGPTRARTRRRTSSAAADARAICQRTYEPDHLVGLC
jgi:hypothetical protein